MKVDDLVKRLTAASLLERDRKSALIRLNFRECVYDKVYQESVLDAIIHILSGLEEAVRSKAFGADANEDDYIFQQASAIVGELLVGENQRFRDMKALVFYEFRQILHERVKVEDSFSSHLADLAQNTSHLSSEELVKLLKGDEEVVIDNVTIRELEETGFMSTPTPTNVIYEDDNDAEGDKFENAPSEGEDEFEASAPTELDNFDIGTAKEELHEQEKAVEKNSSKNGDSYAELKKHNVHLPEAENTKGKSGLLETEEVVNDVLEREKEEQPAEVGGVSTSIEEIGTADEVDEWTSSNESSSEVSIAPEESRLEGEALLESARNEYQRELEKRGGVHLGLPYS